MRAADQKIADILDRYGEPFATSVWRVQGTAVIFHKALERIADRAKITFDPPTIVRAERDEAVILVTGRIPSGGESAERVSWSLGEALVGANYRVSGKQAAYVYAMAEKRGKDRVILKLIELSGLVYSEEESDDLKRSNADKDEGGPSPFADEIAGMKATIDEKTSINDLTDLMLDNETQAALARLPRADREEVRDHAKARLTALGWPKGRKANGHPVNDQSHREEARAQ